MPKMNPFVVCAFLLVCAAVQGVAGDVFALPADQFANGVPAYRDNPFQALTTVTGAPAPFAILAKPDGAKFYVVSASTTDSIIILDSTLRTVVRKIGLGRLPQAAAVSPDGTRLLVLAGTLRVFDLLTTGDDEIALSAAQDFGDDPVDLAFSLDSKRAFILSAESNLLTTFNLATNQVEGAVSIPGIATGVAVGPNSYVYVSATNRLYEVDGISGALRAAIELNGLPAKAVFSRDGKYAILANRQNATGLAMLVDLKTRAQVSAIPRTFGSPELLLDQLTVLDDNTLAAVSTTTRQLIQITLSPFALRTGAYLFWNKADVRALTASRELPAASFLFVATSTGISRGALAPSTVQDLGLTGTVGALQLAGAASTAAPLQSATFNDQQSVLASAITQPLVLRVWGADGLPVFGKNVTFSTDSITTTIETRTAKTSLDGFALTRVTVPAAAGTVAIAANVEGMNDPVTFLITVAGGGGGSGATGLLMYSGNGQVVPAGFPTEFPLKVRLTDAQGEPIFGAQIAWAVSQGDGYVSPTSTTDANGIAENDFLSTGIVPRSTSWVSTSVTATAPNFAPVDFIVTTVPRLLSGNPAIPRVDLPLPLLPDRHLTGQVGQVLAGGVRATIIAVAGTNSGSGIPNVGVSLDTGQNPATSPSAACVAPGGAALSDATGTASCDVRFGGVLGTVPITFSVGGIAQYTGLLTVTQGPPGLIRILNGNNQSGDRNAALPIPLSAEISDGFGNLLAGVPVTWEVVSPGTVTILTSTNTTDSAGRVSATVKLGAAPGSAQVRLRAGTAQALFTFTVNITVTTLTKVDGDGQTVVVGQTFAKALVVEVRDDRGNPVLGIPVAFSVVSGTATLATAAPTTDASGRASTAVTAGATPGAIAVTATAYQLAVTFNLTSVPLGPIVSLQNIRNAISGDLGVSPGGIVAIYGDHIADGFQGSAVANNGFPGPLPTTFQGVQVLFGTTPAPIYHVNNISGQQWVVVQAPFTLSPGVTSVTITVGGGSTRLDNVQVKTYQPGIFETLGPAGQRWAVLTKLDGSYVTLDNPVRRGIDTKLKVYCAGLGQTTPPLSTNAIGIPGQTVTAPLVIAVNNSGVRIVSAETMPGVVGVYVVTFEVPADTTAGLDRSLAVAIANADGSPSALRYYSAIPSIQ